MNDFVILVTKIHSFSFSSVEPANLFLKYSQITNIESLIMLQIH